MANSATAQLIDLRQHLQSWQTTARQARAETDRLRQQTRLLLRQLRVEHAAAEREPGHRPHLCETCLLLAGAVV